MTKTEQAKLKAKLKTILRRLDDNIVKLRIHLYDRAGSLRSDLADTQAYIAWLNRSSDHSYVELLEFLEVHNQLRLSASEAELLRRLDEGELDEFLEDDFFVEDK